MIKSTNYQLEKSKNKLWKNLIIVSRTKNPFFGIFNQQNLVILALYIIQNLPGKFGRNQAIF